MPNKKEDVVKALEPMAQALKVAVSELWGIFVRQYVVKGLSELFTAILLCIAAFFLKDSIHFFALIPLGIAIGLTYNVISYLGNPQYFALEDISEKVKDFNDKK